MKTLTVRLSLLIAAVAGAGCSAGTVDPHAVTVVTAIPQNDSPVALALGPQSVFWIDGNGLPTGGIRAVPRSGGTSTILADGQSEPQAIAYADGRVYWVSDGLWSVPEGGGTTIQMALFVDSGGIAVDGQTAWGAFDGDGLTVINVSAGGNPNQVYATTDFHEELGTFALAPDQVLWTAWDAQHETSTLWALPRTGGTPLAIATSSSEHGAVVTDATHAYWMEADSGAIQAIPLDGGAPVTLVSSTFPTAIAIDGGDLYWSDGTRLLKVPAAGGPTVVVADGQPGISSIVLDETSLYWLAQTDTGNWEIRTKGR